MVASPIVSVQMVEHDLLPGECTRCRMALARRLSTAAHPRSAGARLALIVRRASWGARLAIGVFRSVAAPEGLCDEFLEVVGVPVVFASEFDGLR